MIPVECYFALSALLFFIGVYGFTTRRNLIAMLISVELVLNAVDINFAAINRLLYPNGMEGRYQPLALSKRYGGHVHDTLRDWCSCCRERSCHRYYHQRVSQVQE